MRDCSSKDFFFVFRSFAVVVIDVVVFCVDFSLFNRQKPKTKKKRKKSLLCGAHLFHKKRTLILVWCGPILSSISLLPVVFSQCVYRTYISLYYNIRCVFFSCCFCFFVVFSSLLLCCFLYSFRF